MSKWEYEYYRNHSNTYDFKRKKDLNIGGESEAIVPYLRNGEISNIFPNTKFFFINGIQNSFEDARNSAELISDEILAPVELIYSKKYSILGDLKKAIKIASRHPNNAGFTLLQKLIKALFTKSRVIIFAHSRGATVAMQAIKYLGAFKDEKGREVYKSKIQNIILIGLGGFIPDLKKVKTKATIINITNDKFSFFDIVPELRTDNIQLPKYLMSPMSFLVKGAIGFASMHTYKSYHPWIEHFLFEINLNKKTGVFRCKKEIFDKKRWEKIEYKTRPKAMLTYPILDERVDDRNTKIYLRGKGL